VASTTRFIRGECVTVQVGKGERKDVRSPSGCCDSDPFHSNRVGRGGFRVPASSTPPVDLHKIKQMHPLPSPNSSPPETSTLPHRFQAGAHEHCGG
jgi:hypothetical protein